jgi:hypothetical protein
MRDDRPGVDLAVMDDSHLKLTQDLLTKALKKMDQVLTYKIDYGLDKDGFPVAPDPRLEMRLLSLQAKTATATVNMVIHLGDASLRRQAGAKIDKLLEQIKQAHPERFAPATATDAILLEADEDPSD